MALKFGSSATPQTGFSFGATSTAPTFGTSTAPTAFGANTATSAFGANTATSAFGTNTATSAFGAGTTTPAFGVGTGTAAPAFGAGTAAPAFGAGTATPAFGAGTVTPAFGAGTATPAFGAGTATPAFGAGTATPAFGTSTAAPPFGATTATPAFGISTAGSAFGIGTAAPAFGSSITTPAFGSTFGTSSTPAFGSTFGTSLSKPFTGFGTATTTTTGAFGGSFMAPGPTAGAPSMMGPALTPTEQLYSSVLQCSVFGDDRDGLLGRWNLLQASWGAGKAYHSPHAPAVDITPENPLCRFKAIGYTALPSWKDEDGLLSCVVRGQKTSELESAKPQIAAAIQTALGNKPSVKVIVNSLTQLGPDSSEIVFYVNENTRRIPVSEIFPFISGQPHVLQALKNSRFENLTQKVSFSEQQIKEYLDNPPQGVDPRLWKQAQLDNPDPKKLIPVPMIGFKALQQRIHCQETQAKSFQGRLDAIATVIADLQKRHQDTLAVMTETKRKQLELSHRVLHVIVKQETTRKLGFTIQPEEEKLRIQLEALHAELSAPTQFKGRLNELLSQIRLQSSSSNHNLHNLNQTVEKYEMDPFMQQDIRNLLKQQQDGIMALVEMIKDDSKDLQIISQSLNKEKENF